MAIIVNSIGTNGRDFSTISAWAASLPADIVASGNSYVGELYNDSVFTSSTAFLTLSGITTDATHTITLRCAVGNSWRDNPNALLNAFTYNSSYGVSLNYTGSFSQALTIGVPNVIIDGIQVNCANDSTVALIANGSASNVEIRNSILISKPANQVVNLFGSGPCRIINSLVVNNNTNASHGICLAVGSIAVNCTVVKPSRTGGGMAVYSSYGTAIARNCALFGFSGSMTGTFNADGHNCTDLAVAPGTVGNQVSKLFDNQFVNSSTDFRVVGTTADLYNTGVTELTYVPSGTDAIGTARPQSGTWDIGAIEYKVIVATAVTLSGPSAGYTNVASSNFTVGTDYALQSSVTVTPSDSGGGGTFTPASVVISSGTPTATFTYTPTTVGTKSISVTNDGSLTNPAPISYSVTVAPSPSTGTITSEVISGQTITISGTTTSNPTSGTANLTGSNGGVSKGPTAITLGTGTFTVQWVDNVPGTYDTDFTFTNAAGNGPTVHGSTLQIIGVNTGAVDAYRPPFAITGTTHNAGALTGSSFSSSVARAQGEGLIVFVYYEYDAGAPSSLSTVVWDPVGDNQSFTLVQSQAISTNQTIAVYSLASPASAKTANIVLTFSGTLVSRVSALTRNVVGHNPNAMIRSSSAYPDQVFTSSSPITQSVSTLDGDLVIDFVSVLDALSNISASQNQANVVEYAGGGSATRMIGSSSLPSSASSATMSWTTSNTTDVGTAYITASIQPAQGLGWQESDDVVSGSIAVSLVGNGTLAWTESDDLTSISANTALNVTTALAWTEDDDIAALTANNSLTPPSGTISWTEADDALSLSSLITISGSTAWTEADDISSLSSAAQVADSMVWVEDDDVSSISGSLTVSSTISWVEDDDLQNAQTSMITINWSESDDAASADGIIRLEDLIGLIEEDDSYTLTGGISFIGSASWVEDDDTTALRGIAPVTYFDAFSITLSSFTIPDHCASYPPDNNHDGACRVIIAPDPSLGAQRWTYRGKWITIGVYRDEGRAPTDDVNFYEDYIVFRLLPSFKLIPYSFVQELLKNSAPAQTFTKRSLIEITTGNEVKIPNAVSRHTNYKSSPNLAVDNTSLLERRFNQLYDEDGNPMKLSYDAMGYAIKSALVDSKYKNNPLRNNQTRDGLAIDPRVYVYDYYGRDINDPNRSPYFAADIIIRDEMIASNVNNIKVKTDINGDPLYVGGLFDEFGNVAVGIQENNALVVRQNVMPVTLDQFNRPVKTPLKKA